MRVREPCSAEALGARLGTRRVGGAGGATARGGRLRDDGQYGESSGRKHSSFRFSRLLQRNGSYPARRGKLGAAG